MRYYLGIDGGGTKTASVILDEDKRELGRGSGGPCNIATCDDATLATSVKESTESALESADLPMDCRFSAACAGVAGYTAKQRRAEFARIFAESVPANSHRVEPDYVIAYWGATEGEPGIIVIAGTGASVYGRNAEGQSARADGLGYLLGDDGSGFRMALSALRRIIQFERDGIPHLPLSRRILAAIGAFDSDDVVEWLYRDFSPARVAGLMSEIADLANDGDPDSREIMRKAARNLANRSVRYVARLLGADEGDLQIYVSGGIWDASPLYERYFSQAIEGPGGEWKPPPASITINRPRHDSAAGAALLAISSPA